jgi:hypothetical protein
MTQLSRQSSSVSHTGIATFCKAPYIFSPEELWPDADVAILYFFGDEPGFCCLTAPTQDEYFLPLDGT